MITFRNVVGYFQDIANAHYMIKSFHSGFMDEVDINKLGAVDYSILYIEPGQATINTGVMNYTFTVYILDMINEEVGESTPPDATQLVGVNQRLGRLNTLSESLQILNDVIIEFKQNLYKSSGTQVSYVNEQLLLDLPITCEPFTARFNNLLTGWSATLSLQVDNPNSLCLVPIEANS
jgi:hypothetical protein